MLGDRSSRRYLTWNQRRAPPLRLTIAGDATNEQDAVRAFGKFVVGSLLRWSRILPGRVSNSTHLRRMHEYDCRHCFLCGTVRTRKNMKLSNNNHAATQLPFNHDGNCRRKVRARSIQDNDSKSKRSCSEISVALTEVLIPPR